ncbi:hypothetical protein T492DRAFT_1100408 [Pavlovales sp. CCMP2436]|nr:hypothetical protein T492DRAFT_1100408 [Pavlovales sp. CCMP2436]|mmetsp:Transcript_41990/g.104099  ORF Transcript_41990/g.104099 Transcript_41990/m.104099 type:complete len:271 (+) Transcript_41990:205-1017(+)
MYDPALRAALEMSVQPNEDESMGAPQAGRGGRGGEGPPGSRAAPIDADAAIDADAELAASLAGGDDDETHERHMRHPDGMEASYAQAARRSFQVQERGSSARDLLLEEQNREYEESLATDRAREKSLAEESTRAAAQARAAGELEAVAMRAVETAAVGAAVAAASAAGALEAARARVVAQPDAGEGVITVAVRLAEGGRLMRRFASAQFVGTLYDWLGVALADQLGQSALPAAFTIVSQQPRTVHGDRSKSLAESGLTDRQSLVFIEPAE